MARSAVKKSYFNANIFHINGVPMRFYLEGYDDCEFHEIAKIVEAYGGKLSLPDSGTIVFSEPGCYAHTDRRRFHVRCLRDSIVHNKLQDINKYALPWRIISGQKDCSPPKDITTTSENDEKPLKEPIVPLVAASESKKSETSKLPEPYVLIQDCLTTHSAVLKQPRQSNSRVTQSQTSKNVIDKEPSVISSCRSNPTPSFVQPKIADKPSPIAVKSRANSLKIQNASTGISSTRRKSPRKNVSLNSNNAKSTTENLQSTPSKTSQFVEIIKEVREKAPVIHEIIEISDSEDSNSQDDGKKGPEASKKCLKSSESNVDWKSVTNFDVPNSYAVWSSAGPPGPPPNLSDSDGEMHGKDTKIVGGRKIKEEKDDSDKGVSAPRTRKKTKHLRYDDWDTDSDGPGASKTAGRKRKSKRMRRSYEYDQNYTGKGVKGEYTDEENRKIIQYLIDNGLIAKSTELDVWMKFSIKKIIVNPVRKPELLKRHFEDQLIFNFEKYTKDPIAVKEFSKIRNELI